MGEGKIFGFTIKDPVWYLVVYPVVFAMIFLFLSFLINNKIIVTSETMAGMISVVLAGFTTLIWRMEAKKGKI